MNVDPQTLTVLRNYAPQLETYSLKWKIWVAFLSICIIVGVYALYLQVVKGHGVTGMGDHIAWGIYIANFIFFIGVSYAGAVIISIMHLLKVRWRGPIIRIALLITLFSAMIGPIYILLCVGRLDRLHYLFIYPRLQSPIVWDVLSIVTFVVGALILLYLTLIKDFALYRDSDFLKFSHFRKWVYRKLALGYQGTEFQKKQIRISMNLMALIIVPMVIIVSSVLSWIFGMTLRPGWHSSIFGPYFVLAAIYSGTAVIIVTMWIFNRIFDLKHHLEEKHFVYMGYILLLLAAAYGYFTFSEFLTSWYVSEKWESEVLEKLFNMERYGWSFLYSNVIGILLPIIVIAYRKTRTSNWIAFVSFLAITALWIKRYLIIIPTMESTLLPMQELNPVFRTYSPTWVEIALIVAGMAAFLLFYKLAAKFITIIPVSELTKADLEEHELPALSDKTNEQ